MHGPRNKKKKIFVIGLEFMSWIQDAENLRPLVLGSAWGLNITEYDIHICSNDYCSFMFL
jgi:hypothetical protein